MSRVELIIQYTDGNTTKTRAIVNKWKFQDAMMGEQFISFTVTSEKPIDWAIGDYCVFRGETFTLNNIPSVVQKARTGERQDAYTYENVKLESRQEELTRVIMLDITPTTGEYVPALGTNYTGSSKFQLFCGETSAVVGGVAKTFTPVCALAAKMQANLDRAFGVSTWRIYVDTETTYENPSGRTILVTHTDDKVMSFDNTTVAQALSEVHNTFDLNYCVKGRNIYIGYTLHNLTSDEPTATFDFGYGKGYPTPLDSGKALFQIKRIANSQQKIVTRLRALGSTKNLPYRYYNNKYGLSQSLFPTNLQLPDTFEEPSVKESHNAERDRIYGISPTTNLPYIRHVKGETNDAYIDKNDNAESCVDGVREDCARWDGSNSDLPEIYPTIEEATYGELRGSLVPDQDGNTGSGSFPGYDSNERVDELLAIGYMSGGMMVDDANQGGGILPESSTTGIGIPRTAVIGLTSLNYNSVNYGDFTPNSSSHYSTFLSGPEMTLFTVNDVFPGRYIMTPTGASYDSVRYGFNISSQRDGISADVGFLVVVKQKSKETSNINVIATYISDFTHISRGETKEVSLPEIPDAKEGSSARVEDITVTETSDIIVSFAPIIRNVVVPSGFTDNFAFVYQVGKSRIDVSNPYEPEYTWKSLDEYGGVEDIFHVFIKDMGFDITACFTGDTPLVAMKSGHCVGREFEIGENVEKVIYRGKKGYMLTLHRATDSSLNTYYPSSVDPIAPGDNFVLLNINMPDAYVKMAEFRLLRAATDYLADNCETQFTYQPYLDDIYLQRNYDKMVAAGTPQLSIFWRLYAGLKFTFRGIPSHEDDPLPLAELTIEQVSISMGEGLTPKVEITLNDDVQQTTLQKLTISVDRIYNTLNSANGGRSSSESYAMLISLLNSEGGKRFLSKVNPDAAHGLIDFLAGLHSDSAATFGDWLRDVAGAGIYHDDSGWHVEADYLHARKKLVAKELQIEEVTHVGGQQLLSAAEMVCDYVVEHDTFYRCYFLKVGENGRVIHNKWKSGDQAKMQSFNVDLWENGEDENRSYWRLVVGTSLDSQEDIADYNQDFSIDFRRGVYLPDNVSVADYHFIDLSKTDCDAGSSIPIAGDKIVQLGYRNNDDPSRQNAIMLAGAGTASPYIDEYVGINSYSLEGKCLTRIKPNENMFSGLMHLNPNSTIDGNNLLDILNRHDSALDSLGDQIETMDDEFDGIRDNITGLTTGNENLLRNTGFTGDYETTEVSEDIGVRDDTKVYSDPLEYWTSSNVAVVVDINSASGFAIDMTSGSISQDATTPLEVGEWYNVSLRARGTHIIVKIGGYQKDIVLTETIKRYYFSFQCTNPNERAFTIIDGFGRVMEIMLSAGKIPNADWIPSSLDNSKAIAYFQDLLYLANAITNASTDILGGLILTNMIRVGNYRDKVLTQETGGLSGTYANNNSPFIWGGGTMEQAFYTIGKYAQDPSYQPTEEEVAQMANFVVTHGGRAILNDVILRGYIYALGGMFNGTVYANDGVFNGTIHATAGDFIGKENLFEFNVSADERAIVIEGPNEVSSSDPTTPAQGAHKVEYMRIGRWATRPSGSGYRITPMIVGRTLAVDGETTAMQFSLDAGNGLVFVTGSGASAQESARYTGFEIGGNDVGIVILGALPTSDANLVTGQVWNDNGTLKIKQ